VYRIVVTVNNSGALLRICPIVLCSLSHAAQEQSNLRLSVDDAYFINSLGKSSISIFHQCTACHRCQEKVLSLPKIGSVKSYHEEDRLLELRLLVSVRALFKIWISRMSSCWALSQRRPWGRYST